MIARWRGLGRATALAVAVVGCSSTDRAPEARPAAVGSTPPVAAAASPASPVAARPRIAILGDSLTAGLGLQAEQAYPSLLQERLNGGGLDYEVVNAGVSGDTSAGGLARIVERAQARGITVILAGMEAPPNFGRDYIVAFHKVYPALAEQYRLAFVPFLLDGVAGNDRLNQRDGIHPTADGARIVADNVWKVLGPIAAGRTETRVEKRSGT